LISLDPPVIGGAEELAGERADHAEFLSSQFRIAAATRPAKSPDQLTVTRRGAVRDPAASAQ
jgi:hypothetical protein